MELCKKFQENKNVIKTFKDCRGCGEEHKMKKEFCPAYGKNV